MNDDEFYKLAIDALKKYGYVYNEDILQEIVMYMFEKYKYYDSSRGELTTYMYKLVKNKYLCLMRLNSTKKRGGNQYVLSLDKVIDEDGHSLKELIIDNNDNSFEKKLKNDILAKILPLVEEPLLLWLEGKTQEEIRQQLNISSQAQVSRLINANIMKIKNYCDRNNIEYKITN